ncbi:MAG: amino acid adenylation domain-containing protein [Polyangiaceae bacterium]|nr:amino acid adenylation domain-containing protein [Polyangiaceae bacterium]
MASKSIEWAALGLSRSVRGLGELLLLRAEDAPSAVAFRFVESDDGSPEEWTNAKLFERASAVGAYASELARGGEPAILLYPQGLEYIAAFFGCLLGGLTPVPLLPARSKRGWGRIEAVLRASRARVVLTTAALEPAVRGALGPVAASAGFELRSLATDNLGGAAGFVPVLEGDERVAFLQYTSGSTASPRGVEVSHHNLLRNLWTIRRAFEIRRDSLVLSWLPLYHDMGLIGGVFEPLFAGVTGTLLSPVAFAQRPLLWLRAVSRFGATISGGPNFAFRLCVERARAEGLAGLRLDSWEVAFCGAERVSAEVMRDFAQTFEPAGFDARALLPCYGLAEATLFVSGGPKGRGARTVDVSRAGLSAHRVEPPAEPPDRAGVVSCGLVPEEHEVRIVDVETGLDAGSGRVGEIWVAGPNVARGYWGLPAGAAGAMAREGQFLRTGDLGFVAGREVYVTGRTKEMLAIRGTNLYPQDLEAVAEASHPALVAGASAAFSIVVDDAEEIALVMEVTKGGAPSYPEVAAAVRRAISEVFQQRVHVLALVRRNTVPRTTSGKTQRALCRKQLEEGALHALYCEGDVEAADGGAGVPSAGADAGPPGVGPADPGALATARAVLVEAVARAAGVEPSRVDLARSAADYGLSSLSAAGVAHALEAHFGRTVGLELIFEAESLGEALEAALRARAPTTLRAVAAGVDAAAGARLTPAQLSIWAAQKLVPEGRGYLIARAFALPDGLDDGAWGDCLAELVACHPLLGARVVGAEAPYFERLPEGSVGLERVTAADDEDLARLVSERAMRPFDLASGPLLRAALVASPSGKRVLAVTAHHVIADFRALVRLLDDWSALYEARRSRRPAGGAKGAWPPELAGPVEGGEGWHEAREYWSGRLAGELPVLELPQDFARPRVHRQRGREVQSVAAGAATALDAVARECQTTRFVVALAAYVAFLQRWAGQYEFVVGTPVNLGDAAPPPDFVPLRLAAPPGVRFRDLVRSVRSAVLEAIRFSRLPFFEIRRCAGASRAPGALPLFQASFSLHEAPPGADPGVVASALNLDAVRVGVGRVALVTHAIDDDGCQGDLMLSAGVVGDDVALRGQADADLFGTDTARAMVDGFAELLGRLVRDPDAPIDAPAFGAPSVARGRPLAAGPVEGDGIVGRVERWAGLDPAAGAVAARGRRLSRRELLVAAAGVAARLRTRGVRPGDPVVLAAEERSAEGVAAMLGVLLAGAWFVPLSGGLPAARARLVREDLGARAAVAVAGPRHAGPFFAAGFDVLDPAAVGAGGAPTAALGAVGGGHDIAYAIYTSGSTGAPKAVLVEHAQVVHFANAVGARYGIGPADVMVSRAPWSFDAAIFELPVFLMLGGRVYVADDDERQSAATKLALLRAEGATVHNDTPVAFRDLLEEMLAGARRGEPPPPVKTWVVGGEATTPKDVERLRAAYAAVGLPPAAFINSYGPTEVTVFVTEHACAAKDARAVRVPIGRPLPGMTALVLDDERRPVPRGARGVLYASGPAVARGYLNRPELSAAAFFPSVDPEAPPGTRMYRTGDLVRLRADGELDFLGRADRQVKLRGHRIELAEIEHAAERHEAVSQALVVARELAGGPALVAYAVPRPGRELAGRALREHLLGALPWFMVPAVVAVVDALPLGPTGKVDERALPAPELFLERADEREAASPAEATLVAAVGEVLGTRVGPDDHFFELGGDSINALRVVAKLRERGVSVGVRQLLEHPKLSELARLVKDAAPARAAGPSEDEVAYCATKVGPIHRWFYRRAPGDVARFVQWVRLRLPAGDACALASSALEGLARRHRAFAQGFALGPGGEVVRTALPDDRRFRLVIAGPTPRAAEALIDDEIAQGTAFLPDRGPLLVGFLEASDAGSTLVVAAHHFAVDVYSWHVLLSDLGALLRGESLAADGFDFSRYVAAVDRLAAGALAGGAASRWADRLRDFDPEAAYGALGAASQGASGTRAEVELSDELTASFHGAANRPLRTRPQDLLLAALGRALCRELSLRSAPVHVEILGRDEGLLGVTTGVGWCASWVPYVVRDAPDAVEQLAAAKDDRAELALGGLDFLPLLVDGALPSALGQKFLEPGVALNYLGSVGGEGVQRELVGFGLHRATPTSRVEATAHVRSGRLALEVASPPGVDGAAVERVGRRWAAELEALVRALVAREHGAYTRSDFPLLDVPAAAAERLAALPRESAAPGELHAIEEAVPLNALQRLKLMHHLGAPAEGRTNGYVHLGVRGPFDLDAFERRHRALVAAHPALRSVFDWQTLDEPAQLVLGEMPAWVAFANLADEAADGRPRALDALVRRAVSSPIDLARGPVLRVHVVRVAPEEHHVVLTADQVAIDGWSLAAIAAALLSPDGREGAAAARRYALGDLYRAPRPEALGHWAAKLSRAALPPPAALAPDVRGAFTCEARLPPEGASALRARARAAGVTLAALVAGVWGRLMASRSRSGDALIGLTMAGRDAHGDAIGAFIQNVPVLVEADQQTFADVQGAINEAVAHAHFDPAALADALGHPMDAPLFESALVIQNYPIDRLDAGGGRRVELVSASDDTAFPLTALVYPDPAFRLRLHARAGVVSPDEAHGLLASLRDALARAAADPASELGAIAPPPRPFAPQGDAPTTPAATRAAGPATAGAPDGLTTEVVREVLRECFGDLPGLMERNFFDLGGTSLTLLRARGRLAERLGADLPVTALFRAGNGLRLAEALRGRRAGGDRPGPGGYRAGAPSVGGRPRFAIVGMAGRFPGANGVDELWANLSTGRESIVRLPEEVLGDEGRALLARDPSSFVGASAELADIERFDAALFDISPREAELLDPQQRLLLELAYQAIEDAGYHPRRAEGSGAGRRRVGVFASTTLSSYLIYNLLSRDDIVAREGAWRLAVANEKDCGPSRVAYKLGLTGPAVAVQSTCSSSLVAVHVACASLASGECDMALAGGVSVRLPRRAGYSTRDAEILSRDGRCAPFGEGATGTVMGDGAGLVVLKRLEDAVRDGDAIYAVVLGSAVNNDGRRKAGYTAPSVEGQREVIAGALARAGVRADSIQLLEAHGTGTPLGDPIEVEALAEAYRSDAGREAFCALGSIKSNLGHLDNAAGVAGLIKCALALVHGLIPPTLHGEPANPALPLAGSPFYVASAARPWPATDGPRRAAVSSFGIGGTNAHAILEAAPSVPPAAVSAPGPELLPLSARTEEGLSALAERWSRHLASEPAFALADAARTAQHAREEFPLRRAVVGATAAEIRGELARPRPPRFAPPSAPPVVVVFPGQGSQYRGMLRGLRAANVAFREAEDACVRELGGEGGPFGRALLGGDADLTPTRLAQVAIFVASYAMLEALRHAGVRPAAYVGHSVGELVAAVASGALALADALAVVRRRGEAMAAMPPGAMLAVPLGRAELGPWLPAGLDLAAVNGERATVVAGPPAEVEAFERLLAERKVGARRLVTSHAFHSRLCREAAERFGEALAGLLMRAPFDAGAPVFSTVTGDAVATDDLREPHHWRRQIETVVDFHGAVAAAKRRFPDAVFVEAGPGQALSTLLRADRHAAVPLGRHPARDGDDPRQWLAALGELWELGVAIDFERVSPPASFRRRRAPGAILEPRRFWIEPKPTAAASRPEPRAYLPAFREAPREPAPGPRELALFHADEALEGALVGVASEAGCLLRRASAGEEPATREGALAAVLAEREPRVERLHAFLRWVQRLATERPAAEIQAFFVSRGAAPGTRPAGVPEWAFGHAAGLVAQMEVPNVRFRAVDVAADASPDEIARTLLGELDARSGYPLIAWRGGQRLELGFEPFEPPPSPPLLRPGDVVLVVGGLGAIGRELSGHLARRHGARVVVGTRRRDVTELALATGAPAPCVPVDVTDPASIAAALDVCEARFGPVAGIFHAAGVDKARAFGALEDLTLADYERHFETKVVGTRNLARAIEGRGVRYVVLFSSLSAWVGGFGCGAHAPANRFLDAFAGDRGGVRWRSVAWDRWALDGDPVRHTAESRRLAFSAEGGLALLDGLLTEGTPPSVVVCTEEPARRLRGRVGAEASTPAAARHERPLLRTGFVAPESEIETAVAKILAETLALNEVGVLDDLFDLGASSLHSAQIAEGVRSAFGIRLTLKQVFEARNVRALAVCIEEALLAEGDPEELRRLLEEIE